MKAATWKERASWSVADLMYSVSTEGTREVERCRFNVRVKFLKKERGGTLQIHVSGQLQKKRVLDCCT
ncbi:MAG: hypothetical protein EOP06_13180 [Proteobacteria bacterium]|nr:MAG: hypothetical protein EOP06_13180 [Pseudomonadota bacterium]